MEKTEHLSTNKGKPLQMKLNGEELKNVDHFKYLGSVIDTDGTMDRDVQHSYVKKYEKLPTSNTKNLG